MPEGEFEKGEGLPLTLEAILFILREDFSEKDAVAIRNFLNRGFSDNGKIVIASIFLFTKGKGKTAGDILRECEKEWKRNWNFQHPELRGDPDAPGGAGMRNRMSLENIYKALEIPSFITHVI